MHITSPGVKHTRRRLRRTFHGPCRSSVNARLLESNDANTLFLYKNIFYKSIEAEICVIFRIFDENV